MTIIKGEKVVCKKDFEEFTREQRVHNKIVNKKLVELEPLTGIVEPVKEIIENRKAMERLGKTVAIFVGIIVGIISIFYTIYKMFTGR